MSKVLVAYTTKYGSTAEVAQSIAEELRQRRPCGPSADQRGQRCSSLRCRGNRRSDDHRLAREAGGSWSRTSRP